jgi:hypothetical protein
MSRTGLDYERVSDGSTEIFDAVTGRVIVRLLASLSFIAAPLWHLWRITSSLMRRVKAFRETAHV